MPPRSASSGDALAAGVVMLMGSAECSRQPEFQLIGSIHEIMEGAVAPPGAVHVSYVFSPMRYVWDRHDDYFGPGRAGLATRT